MIKEAIVKIVDKQDLTYDEAYSVMNEIMSGETTPTQNAAFLAALSTKSTKSETIEKINSNALLKNAISDLDGQSMLLSQAALNALKYYGRISDENGTSVLQKVSHLEGSENHVEKEILSILKFEFGVDS